MNIEKYNVFIEEQKDYFNQNLQSNFKWSWNDSSWYGGTIGSERWSHLFEQLKAYL